MALPPAMCGLRFLVGVILLTSLVLSQQGCSNRPDPTMVKKDGGDDEDNGPVVRQPVKIAAAVVTDPTAPASGEPSIPPVADANSESPSAQSGAAPFDTKFLPADSEVIIGVEMNNVVRSELVNELTGGNITRLSSFVRGLGVHIGNIEWVRIGIRNLDAVPLPSPRLLSADFQGLQLLDFVTHPDLDSTMVIKSADRVEVGTLAANSEVVKHNGETYYRLPTNQFDAPCAYVTLRRILIVASEPTIQTIIAAGKNPPQPMADFSFARKADVVVAFAPKDRKSLLRWLPAGPEPANSESEQQMVSADDKAAITDHAENVASTREPADPFTTPETSVAQPIVSIADDSIDEPAVADGLPESDAGAAGGVALLPLLHEHANAMAFHVNLSGGVAVSLSVRCDAADAADQLNAAASASAEELQAWAGSQKSLPGGFVALANSLRFNATSNIAFVSGSVPVAQQVDLTQLPGFLLGISLQGDSPAAEQMLAGVGLQEAPGELAERTIVEGIAALTSEARSDGMELRALARWRPVTNAAEPRQLELAVVAFGGGATSAVAFGQMHLEAADVNRLTPLKWLGSSHGNDAYGRNPLDGFIPIDRNLSLSTHPPNGVLAVYLVVPPSDPADVLRRFAGQFQLRYFSTTDDVVIADVRSVLTKGEGIRQLTAAGVEIDVRSVNSRETVEIFHDETAGVGSVQLVQADGTPVPNVKTNKTISQGKVLRSLFVEEGPLPEGVGLRITLNSELKQLAVPFEFANLPIPDVGELSDSQRATLIWTVAERGPEIPQGLSIEAQARWNNPERLPATVADVSPTRTSTFRKPTGEDKDDDVPARGLRSRSHRGTSEMPLRVLVDLTGSVAEAVDAIGGATVTSIETDFGSELTLEGASFRNEDVTGRFLAVKPTERAAENGPPDGVRLAFHFTPPLEPINQLVRFNGLVKLRTTKDRREVRIDKLHERVGKKLTDRELSQLGLSLVAAIQNDQILVRLIDGNDEQLSQIVPIDAYGDPTPGVTSAVEPGTGRSRGRLIHTLSFANGVPPGVGLRVVVNSGVSEIDVPFRFTHLPVPPMPTLANLGLSQR